MEQILITRANGTVELINSTSSITSIISAEHRKAALGEDVVVMSVESAVDRAFGIGDSIRLLGGNTYKINQIPSVEKISERQFRYELVFEGIQYDLLRVLYRNEDVSSFSTSSEFALTGDIEMFLNVLINNANRTFGANKWALGDFPTNTETKNLLFSNENCLTVLQRICAEYSYEFTFTETSTQKILNVKRVGSELDFTFEYGKGKGLYNLKRDSVDSKKIINKLFVYGSTKNIPANYKNYSQRLHFGTVSPFTESVVSDSVSIAAFGVCEGSIIFDDVFPTGYNSITSINTSNRLEFTDTSMSFDLNAKDGSGNTLYLIPGVTAKIHFNSGNLAGYEFEVEKYTHSTKKFLLKAVTDEKGLTFPSSTESAFQLAVGDSYSLLDIVMPQSLIDAAESLLQSKGVDYLNENKNPIVKYTVAIDEEYLKTKTSDLNIFNVGDSVVVKDSDFGINTRIKIVSFSRNVLFPYRYSIVVSDVPEVGILRSLAIKSADTQRIIRHNGFSDPVKFQQNPNSNTQIQSQIDETINRKPSVIIGRDSDNISLGNKENQTLVDILGRLGIRNQANFLAEFSVGDLTANRVVTLPDRNIEINKWADLSGVPDKLGSLISLSTNGIVRQTGTNSFAIGTNDPIVLSGDASGSGTTSIAVTLANTTVAAGTYKSVTVDPKGRVIAATNPTTIAGYGITDFADNWNTRWNAVKAAFINFQSSIEINQNMTVGQDLYVYGKLFDSVLSEGSASGKQFLRSTYNGFRWTTLDKSYISDFSTGVLGQVLTGLVAGSNTAISSNNTVLTAFQNLQSQITNKTIDKLTFGVGYLQNSSDALGFVYKPSGISPLNNTNYYTGEFRVNEITQNRTWKMPNYDGTLTTYEKVSTDFWKLNGNNVSQDGVFDIINATTAYNYLWKINGQTKMQLTPAGNMSVGGIAPEAVIHAHATVVGNTEVIALKASNNVNSAYFSIGIDSTNNRTNLYSGGEVWATTISKFKFGVADVNGLWTYSVIPQTTADATTGNQLVRLSQVQTLLSGGFAVSTACKLVFVDNQSLSGAKTQGGYTTITGDNILLTGQSTASQNGVYVFDGTNWARNTANDTDAEIRNKGHLVTNGTYANTQWVNNNASTITVGTTAITYAQWSGAETDPVWEAYKTTNNLTPARFTNWDLAFGWGNHANLYVDKTSAQNNIAGAKVFTTSIQSPIVKAGTDSLNITISNISGTSPRVASNGTLDFTATTRFDWLTTGNIGRMRLTTTGLRIGSTSDPLYTLHAVGTIGLDGLISLGRVSQNIAMSSGSVGQFIRRSLVNNGFYNVDVNEWANITTSDIVGLSTNYQAKLNGSGFVKMNGTDLSYENFGEFGQYQTHTQYTNISSIPWGASFVNGTTTDLPNNGLQAHVVKMSIGSEYPSQATYLAIPRPFGNYFDGQIYVRGIYGVVDSGWISVGGGNFKDYDFDEYEATIKYHGYFYNNTPEGREGFIGFNRLDGGVILEYKYTEIDSNVTTTYRNFMDSSGRLCYQIDNGGAKRYALLEEVSTGGGGVSYTLAEPLYFSGNQINIRTASASQIGALSAADWDSFNKKLSDGGIINDSLKVAFAKQIRFMASNGTDIIHKEYSTWTGTNRFHEDTTGDRSMGVTGILELNANRYFLNGFEIDMSGFATGKVLKATSSSKAQWVTL